MRTKCDTCGEETGKSPRWSGQKLNCEKCKAKRAQERKDALTIKSFCLECNCPILLDTHEKRSRAKKQGGILCSQKCITERRKKTSGALLTQYIKENPQKSMKETDPIRWEKMKIEMTKTLKRIGHQPKTRGGNGRQPPIPQQRLFDALGEGWVMEYPIKTKDIPNRKELRLPTCYKSDIANPNLMIAIEVNGSSHTSLKVQEKDKKKERILVGLGWKTLVFTNQEVMEHLEESVQTVLSIISKQKNTTPTLPIIS